MTNKIGTDIMYFKDDVGKNLYRKKTYYTLVVEQDVLANDKDEADKLFLDHGGLDHSKIGKDISQTGDGVETFYVDANYTDSDTTKYIGKVKYDTDTYNQSLEDAMENGDIEIDTWADEKEEPQVVETKQEEPFMVTGLSDKEESDIDVALNLEAESKMGK